MTNYIEIPEGEIPTTVKCDSENCNNTFMIIGRVGTITGLCVDCWAKREILLKQLTEQEFGKT